MHPTRRTLLRAFALTGAAGAGALGPPRTARAQGGAGSASVRAAVSSRGLAAVRRGQSRAAFMLEQRGLRLGLPLYLRVLKEAATLETWFEPEPGAPYRPGRTFRLCGEGARVTGPRTSGADLRVPEGLYTITRSGLNLAGNDGLALALDWPNSRDRSRGWNRTPAGRRAPSVWFEPGCAAAPSLGLTDQDMDELFTLVYAALAFGQAAVPVQIFPFPLSRWAMTLGRGRGAPAHARSHWQTLAPAWRAFEDTQRPLQESRSGP
jgi:murein L,D-transpeptidase YafK